MNAIIGPAESTLALTYPEASVGDFHVFYGLTRNITPIELGLGGP
jgi:hypothetical protein